MTIPRYSSYSSSARSRRSLLRWSSGLIVFVCLVSIYYYLVNSASDLQDYPVMPFPDSKYVLTAVPGFFRQSEADTDASVFDYAKNNYGLIDRSYETDQEFDPDRKKTQWQRFAHYVHYLNRQTPETKAEYKVLYLGRHGQGYHNVAESYFGTAEWDRYWSLLDGGEIDNKTVVWSDAHLTPTGIADALAIYAFWKDSLAVAKIPAPQKYYTSPLHRCCETASISFTGLQLPETAPFVPQVRELLRETNGEHTCDRRSSKTHITTSFPSYTIEPGFTENDELWHPDVRETWAEITVRQHKALEDIFELLAKDGVDRDDATFLSITSHSGSIAAILRAVGHRLFALPTGGTMPLFVKVERRK